MFNPIHTRSAGESCPRRRRPRGPPGGSSSGRAGPAHRGPAGHGLWHRRPARPPGRPGGDLRGEGPALRYGTPGPGLGARPGERAGPPRRTGRGVGRRLLARGTDDRPCPQPVPDGNHRGRRALGRPAGAASPRPWAAAGRDRSAGHKLRQHLREAHPGGRPGDRGHLRRRRRRLPRRGTRPGRATFNGRPPDRPRPGASARRSRTFHGDPPGPGWVTRGPCVPWDIRRGRSAIISVPPGCGGGPPSRERFVDAHPRTARRAGRQAGKGAAGAGRRPRAGRGPVRACRRRPGPQRRLRAPAGRPAAEHIVEQEWAAVLILTAFGHRDKVARATRAGVMAYLVKPFDKADLVPAIEVAVQRWNEARVLANESKNLTERLETRKLVERAKGVLRDRHGLSEADAFRLIQRISMERGMPMRKVSERLLDGDVWNGRWLT